jgi:predicted dehydrogenase
MTRLRGVGIGAGYFSQYHYEAWSRIAGVEITAVCDREQSRAAAACERFGVARHYSDFRQALEGERPDFVDIVTPPESHFEICQAAAEQGAAIICQKPLAPSFGEARALVEHCARKGVRLMVHENFRFQPWHREIKRLLDAGAIGGKLHALTFRSRPGDGWGDHAYLGRQPYFRTMPRLLVQETGVHFVDTFRYLAGEVVRVYGLLRRLNPVVAGEDCGLLILEFAGGAIGVWDANRYNESTCADPRYTFGEFLVEADGGSIRLAPDGTLTVQRLGEPEARHDYVHEHRGFSSDCVFATQQHFVDRLRDGGPFETEGQAYLETLHVVEAVYESARRCIPIDLTPGGHHDAALAL